MEQSNKKGKFYCSRCKAIHADGTSRFCADCGGRLVPVDDPKRNTGEIGGMFSKIVGKAQPESEQVELESFSTSGPEGDAGGPGVSVPVIRGTSPSTIQPVANSGALPSEPRAATAPLIDPSSQPKVTTELTTGDLFTVTSATQQEASVNLSTGPLKFEPLGSQAQLSPEQLARLASTGELKLLLGKKISDRFLVSELLAGGLGRATYAAVDLHTNEKVLVQMFPGEAFDVRAESSVYGDALRNVSRFRDADFAVVLGSGRLPDGRVVVISEYVEGNSIAQVIGFAGAFDTNRAARLVRKIADAINEAHQYGVFHGSLRAENVVLLRPEDLQDKIKIIGLGVTLADGEALSSGVPTAADDAHDLAVIAYQMLTGRNPFPGPSAEGASSLGTIVPVRSIRPELPQQVEYVLNKAMSRISAERYSDVRDFGDSFYAALTGTTTSGKLAQPKPEAESAVRSERIQIKELFAKEPPVSAPSVSAPAAEVFEAEGVPLWKKAGRVIAGVVIAALLAGGLYYAYRSQVPAVTAPANVPAETKTAADAPIAPRNLERPADSEIFVNSKTGLSGEMANSFVPFQVFYPKTFSRNPSKTNFLDLSQKADGGITAEQFIVTSYSSDGTFEKDKLNFPKLVEKSNGQLQALLGPGYRAVSQGETTIQDGRLRAYEVKFEFSGKLGGRDTQLWGRRLYIPLQRADAKFGFVVTLIATNLAKDVRGVEDLGTKGATKTILDSFEPGK